MLDRHQLPQTVTHFIRSGMRMDDPIPQYSHLVAELASRHPKLAYVHVVEPRVSGHEDREIVPGEVCQATRIVTM